MIRIDPKTTAVVSIDMHRGHLDPTVATMPLGSEQCRRVIGAARELFATLRPLGIPIVHMVTLYRDSGEAASNPFWKAIANDPGGAAARVPLPRVRVREARRPAGLPLVRLLQMVMPGGAPPQAMHCVHRSSPPSPCLSLPGIEPRDGMAPCADLAAPASRNEGQGSIIVVVATDAPLLPHQLKRIATRPALGIGRMGGRGNNGSGDIFVAFSTANPGAASSKASTRVEMLPNANLNPLFAATIQATEEAILASSKCHGVPKGDENPSPRLKRAHSAPNCSTCSLAGPGHSRRGRG